MEFRAVKQFAEDLGNLRLDDPGPVVFHCDPEAVLCQLQDLDLEGGKDARFLARIERVVDGFLDGREQRLLRVVKSQKVTVLREKLRHRDFSLTRGHALRCLPALRTSGWSRRRITLRLRQGAVLSSCGGRRIVSVSFGRHFQFGLLHFNETQLNRYPVATLVPAGSSSA